MDATTRATLEALYAALCGAVVMLAKALNKPSPLLTRAERRAILPRESTQER
jgi:hypothetical protein